jgi:hypothetical protein
MRNLGLLFFLSTVFISCDYDEIEPNYPRTEYYIGQAQKDENWVEVIIVDSMSGILSHYGDTTFQDTIELVYTKSNDDIRVQVFYEEGILANGVWDHASGVLDDSGNYYFLNQTPPGYFKVTINFDGEDSLYFDHRYSFISPSGWDNRISYKFDGVKL